MCDFKEYCNRIYDECYRTTYKTYLNKHQGNDAEEKAKNAAQKEAIKRSFWETMKKFPKINPDEIWKNIEIYHMYLKSGINDLDAVQKAISASQSWKKSSGHAFEEYIKESTKEPLSKINIEFVLQKDLTKMIKDKELSNIDEDILWLKEQINSDIFDLYAIGKENGKNYCFGCIQSKTSVRDRNTRDREPSIHAMNKFFWSICIILDGDYLKNDKFEGMINGGTNEFPINGWHGAYVISGIEKVKFRSGIINRIFSLEQDMSIIIEHAEKAYNMWKSKRHLFTNEWAAGEEY